DANGRRERIGTGLPEADHLRAGAELANELGDFDLEPVRKRVRDPVLELAGDRLIDAGVRMPEQDRSETHREVEVPVPVDVPHLAASRSLDVPRCEAAHELRRTLAERLRTGWDQRLGALGEIT